MRLAPRRRQHQMHHDGSTEADQREDHIARRRSRGCEGGQNWRSDRNAKVHHLLQRTIGQRLILGGGVQPRDLSE